MPLFIARILNLSLLVAFPIAWFAPLLRAGLMPIFGGEDISVISGIATLWDTDIALSLLVAFFALIAPMAKTLAMGAHHWGLLPARFKPLMQVAARLAMADIFLMALYIVVIKGAGVGYVETAWGLWLFTGCVLTSLMLSLVPSRR